MQKATTLETKVDSLQNSTSDLKADSGMLKQDLSELRGLVMGAVAVDVGAYLAPVVGLFAFANAAGFFAR